MSLFIATDARKEATKIAQMIYQAEFRHAPTLYSMAGQQSEEAPFEGLVQTIQLLDMAVTLNQPGIFTWLCAWAYVLMVRRMPLLGEDTVKRYLLFFLGGVKKHLDWLYQGDKRLLAAAMVDRAGEEVRVTDCGAFKQDYIRLPYEDIQRRYLDCLLNKDMDGAAQVILTSAESIPLKDIYTKVIQNVMYEVGELWHQNQISVAQEHYCTAATQTIMAMLYPKLMRGRRGGRKMVVACIGSELHELGARMVCDLFASQGWDSIFLGAAVPLNDLIHTLAQEKPDLLALSVAMKQGLPECADAVAAIKSACPDLVVAVGGYGTQGLTGLGEYIKADLFTAGADELIDQANRLFED